MEHPNLKLECLRLAYEKDKPLAEIIEKAKAFWKFISATS